MPGVAAMRVLLTGAYGQLGRCLLERFPVGWVILACGSAELDITDRTAVDRIVKKFRPDVVMNAAAYTNVDKAEIDRIRAIKVNALGPENLALAARAVNARLIHISTDYVFDGTKKTPYSESDQPCPINFYGLSKWEGEKRVLAVLPSAIIIRSSWLFSEYGNNFVFKVMQLSEKLSVINVVKDQYGCPTYAGDLAQAMIKLTHSDKIHGLYHYCGNEVVSRSEFAQAILVATQQNVIVKGISSSQCPTTAERPKNLILNSSVLNKLNIIQSDWKKYISTLRFYI